MKKVGWVGEWGEGGGGHCREATHCPKLEAPLHDLVFLSYYAGVPALYMEC